MIYEFYKLATPSRWEEMKPVGDFLANAVILGALLDWVPVAAAVLSLIWGAMRIYETFLDIRKKQRDVNIPFPAVVPMKLIIKEEPKPDDKK